MDKANPYAPSRASLAGAATTPAKGSGGAWRHGAMLVLSPEASLPHRCVKCNEPAQQPTKSRRVYWHNPWIYLLIVVNVLVYALVAILVRKKAVIAPGLCPAHSTRRRTGIAIAWALFLIGFVGLFVGGQQHSGGIALFATFLIFASAIVGVIVTRILRAQRIDTQYVRLKGCGTAFLDSMPTFPG